MGRPLARMLQGSALGLAVVLGCDRAASAPASVGFDATVTEDANVAGDAPGDAETDTSSDDVEQPLPCDVTAIAAVFVAKVLPHLNDCQLCHASDGPKWMGKPGPLWFHVGDPGATVEAMVRLGLVAPIAADSPFVRVLIPATEGGIPHKGGTRFSKADAAYADFVDFLMAATPCTAVAP
jgi:hypothetical protein